MTIYYFYYWTFLRSQDSSFQVKATSQFEYENIHFFITHNTCFWLDNLWCLSTQCPLSYCYHHQSLLATLLICVKIPLRLIEMPHLIYVSRLLCKFHEVVNKIAAWTHAFRNSFCNFGFKRLFLRQKQGKVVKVSNVCTNVCARKYHVTVVM